MEEFSFYGFPVQFVHNYFNVSCYSAVRTTNTIQTRYRHSHAHNLMVIFAQNWTMTNKSIQKYELNAEFPVESHSFGVFLQPDLLPPAGQIIERRIFLLFCAGFIFETQKLRPSTVCGKNVGKKAA